MRPRKEFPADATVELKQLLAKATDIREQWRILALLIRAVIPEATAAQIAAIFNAPLYFSKMRFLSVSKARTSSRFLTDVYGHFE